MVLAYKDPYLVLMRKVVHQPYRFTSIAELHRAIGLPKVQHPLVSLFDTTHVQLPHDLLPSAFMLGFYNVSFKKQRSGRTGYGQRHYDFDEGTMLFTAPNQLISPVADTEYFGITLLFHPDFIRHHPLGKAIKRFGFFSYESDEALHLSEKEKQVTLGILKLIEDELSTPIDECRQDIVIAHLETLLNYSNRFYKRQFITRKTANHDLLTQLEHLVTTYFDQEQTLREGLPTVENLAAQLHLSPRYLSDVLRSLTGQNTQQFIHEKLIEKAKEYLAGTSLSIATIAYQLGFEHPQSFNKLFKQKTKLTPLEFKQSLN